MKKFLLIASFALAILLVLLGGAGFVFSENGSIPPGKLLFPLQDFSEQQRARLITSPTERTLYYLGLLERRSADLAGSVGTARETATLNSLNQALEQATTAIGQAPEASLPELKVRLANTLVDIQATLVHLRNTPVSNSPIFARVQSVVTALNKMVGGFASRQEPSNKVVTLLGIPATGQTIATVDATAAGTSATITPQDVVFPPGSAGAQHLFFPLSGKHAILTCQTCHVNGVYANTPAQCAACHKKVTPPGHYDTLLGIATPLDCATCHVSVSWKTVHFDHLLVIARDCQGCHRKVKPAGHFSGQCNTCHNTNAWRPADFNHQGTAAVDCQLCHMRNRPVNHYNGQCSACHSTQAWLPANFDHQSAGAINCQSCHARDKPLNHYSGQCSACHSTQAWLPANFDHQLAGATNCQACHAGDRPNGHFAGQCSACHNSQSWLPASFDHNLAGATDCVGCHSDDRPADHFTGQCSACHSTSTWSGATFNHSGLKDCKSCHSPPGNHWPGQCSQCHSTSGWDNPNFGGHPFDMDHGDANGECAACHANGSGPVNCFSCHDQDETVQKHTEKDILDIAGRCLDCHPNGDKD